MVNPWGYIWSSYGNFGYTCFNNIIIALEQTFPVQINIYVITTFDCLEYFTTQQSSKLILIYVFTCTTNTLYLLHIHLIETKENVVPNYKKQTCSHLPTCDIGNIRFACCTPNQKKSTVNIYWSLSYFAVFGGHVGFFPVDIIYFYKYYYFNITVYPPLIKCRAN